MECRVGYTVDLQFTLNQEDYFFDTLEAVSTTDETQSRADYVEITFNEKASDQSKGIYKYTVKLLKYADDILIRPKCVVLPRGIMHTPDTSDSQYSNTPIILYFNIPVEDEDTTLENSLFTYDNISLLYEDVNKEIIDMSSYFYEPEFNKDKTVLKLIPSGAKIQQLLKQKDLPFITIQVNLSENITVENQGYTFNLRQDNNTNFSVVYNSIGETIPPERKSGDLFYLTKEPITFSSAPLLPDEDKFLQTTYDKNNYEENVKRVVPGTFNIYGRYYDGGSGVRSVEVRETFVKTLNNTETNDSRYPVEFTAKSNEAQFFDEGNGYTTFIIQYTLQEFMLESPRGGIFNIDICIKDGCDNSSLTESFTIINLEYGALNYLYEWYEDGPQVPALANCSFYVYNTSFSISETNSNAYDFEKYNSDIKTIRIKDKTHPTRYCIGGNWSSFVPATEVNYLCEYIDKSGQKRLESFSPFNSQLMERTLTLDVKSVSGVSFTVFAVYNDTIIGRKQFSFPPFPKAEFIDSTEVGLDSLSGNIYRFFGICQNDDGSYNIIYPTTAEYSTTLPDSKNCYFGYFSFLNHIYEEDYTFLTKYYEYNSETNSFTEYDNPVNPYDYEFENNESTVSLKQSTNKRFRNGLVGELMGPFYNGQEQIPIPDSSIIEEYSISNALQKGMCEINLTFGSDLWEKYDSLILNVYRLTGTTQNQIDNIQIDNTKTSVKNGKVSFTFSTKKEHFFEKGNLINLGIIISGTSNDMLLGSSQSILQIQLDNDKAVEWDNIPPGSLNARSFTHDRRFVFDFYDNGSGPKSGKILLNNNITPYIMQSDSQNNKYFIVEIPITDFVFGLNTLSYELTDNNNNVTQGTLELSTDKIKKYPTDIGNYIPYSSGSLKNGKLVLQKNLRYWELNSSVLKVFYTYSGVWTEKNYTAPEDSNTYEITGIPDNSFCRIFYSAKNLFQNNTSYKYVVCFDQIAYKYTGSIGDGTHNYILKNGSAKDSFIVSGDSDVFVRVCYTKEPLSVCQNWSAENWEFMSFYVLEKKLDFRSNSNPQLFEFKTKDIPQGCCYCLVAYYANGKTGTSEVFVK